MHNESENSNFQMYRVDAEWPGQSLYTPTTIGVIIVIAFYNRCHYCYSFFPDFQLRLKLESALSSVKTGDGAVKGSEVDIELVMTDMASRASSR